jgi:LysM repeat protein
MAAYSDSRRGSQSTGSVGGGGGLMPSGPAPGKQSLTSLIQPAPSAAPSGAQTYTVRAGDTLGSIARRLLGAESRWQEIASANGVSDPRALQVGAVLTVPAAAGQGPDAAGASGGSDAAPEGAGNAPDAEPAPSAEEVTHTVARGETLGALAQRYLGDASKWRVIAEANGIDDPRSLRVGQRLVIPGATPGAQPQGPTPTTTTPGTDTTTSGTDTTTPGPVTGTDGRQPGGAASSGNTPDTAQPQPQPQQPTPGAGAAGTHFITDPQAFTRSDPPALASTGERIPAGTKVKILETTVKETRSYVKVEQVLQEGELGPARRFGWTSKANLSGFEGGRHDKENDATLRPDDAVLLGGLSGLERTMATIYNSKAKYLHEQAQALGISTAAAAAVLKVESGGGGFANDGRMIIRFENHVFYDRWGKNNKATFDKHFKFNSDERWKGHQFRASETGAFAAAHQSQNQEWEILEFARGLSNDPALQSISMGAAQIMGFNYATEGYANVQAMFDQMSGAIKPQLVGMFTFIQNTPLCINGLKEGNYVKFARGYNGAGQAEAYGALIKDAADAWTKVTEGKTHGG